ncbi:MAG TPA: hypothetical protein VGG64_14215 [Pirellulales bacterium]
MVEECKFLLTNSERIWRPYVAANAIVMTWAKLGLIQETFPRTVGAMDSLWFLLGTLGLNTEYGYRREATDADRRTNDILVLDRYIRWIPVLDRLSTRFLFALNWIGRGVARPHWAGGAVGAALSAGWKPSKTLSTLGGTTDDICTMEHDGLIERCDGRYRIASSFRNLQAH